MFKNVIFHTNKVGIFSKFDLILMQAKKITTKVPILKNLKVKFKGYVILINLQLL